MEPLTLYLTGYSDLPISTPSELLYLTPPCIPEVSKLTPPQYTLLFSWTLVREMYPNYDVAMFQPQTGTPPDLGSAANCYIAILLKPARPFFACHPMTVQEGLPAHYPPLSPFLTIVSPNRIIHPPEHHLYLSQYTKAHSSLHQTLLPPCIPRPRHACRIPNSAPLPPPKSLLTLHSSQYILLYTFYKSIYIYICNSRYCCSSSIF